MTAPVKPEMGQLPGLTPVVSKMQPPVSGPVATPAVTAPDPVAATASYGQVKPPTAENYPGFTPMGSSASTIFGADNNLLSTQINPVAPTATQPNTNFGTGAVAQQANPYQGQNFQNYTQGFNTALSNVSNGPNRTQLAMQKLQDFDTETQPQFDAGIRKIGQAAAKFGRLGAGMTTNDLTGLGATMERNRMLLKNQLARDVAEGDINDRYRTADLYSGARGQEYGFGADQRDYATGLDERNQGRLFDRQRAGNDYQSEFEDRLFNQQRAGRNDLVGERDFQTGRADKALEDSIRQRMLEESLLESSFGRSKDRLQAGSYGSPADAYERGADQMGNEAAGLMGAGAGLIGQKASQPQSIDYEALLNAILNRQG